MEKLSIGITSTSDRNTINESIKSIRDAGISNKIIIFGEPGEYNIEDKNTELRINKEVLGCFQNFDNMINGLLDEGTEYIRLTQDDYIYNKDIKNIIEDILLETKDFGIYNLHTRPRLDNKIYKRGWNNDTLGWYSVGVSYIMQSRVAREMVNHHFYKNHKLTYTKNQQVDACCGFTIQKLGLPMYLHNPSLAIHIGDSLIGHEDRTAGETLDKPCEEIAVGMASIPNRINELQLSLESLYNQVDTIYLSLNGYKEIPEFCKRSKIVAAINTNEKGDANKFKKVDKVNGYFFACDDDLYYPVGYIQSMIKKIDLYNKQCVIGIHGVAVDGKLKDYYKDVIRYSFNYLLPEDTFVHILGTGVIGFHTSTIKINYNRFPIANMGDIRFGIQAQEQRVPMLCIKHGSGVIQQMNTTDSIYLDYKDRCKTQTDVVNVNERNLYCVKQKLDG